MKTERPRTLREVLGVGTIQKPYLTTGEAATLLETSIVTVKRWAKEGYLDGQRMGGRVRIKTESVDRILDQLPIAYQNLSKAELEALMLK